MTTPLISTKFYVPPLRPGLVPRQRLIDKLNEGLTGKLTLVSASAGFGKTTLLSEYVAEHSSRAAWLTLDANDNEPIRFLTYFIIALQQLDREIGQATLGILQSARTIGYEFVLANLINEIAGIDEQFTLVLDDFHAISEWKIYNLVVFLIDNLPEPMHLVIATRSDPPFPLSRLRVRGQLTEIRQADLRFTLEESARFLNQNLRQELNLDQVRVLERRTEGWIAGLRLAELSMRGKNDYADFIQRFSGSHKFVFDYLVEEVYDGLSVEIQRFVLQTSILDQFNASLCNAVTGREDTDQLIRELESANLFLLPLDDQREWYRFHHLFRDFLRVRLAKPEQLDLHKKAVRWLMSNGFATEAVYHALASEDMRTCVPVIAMASVEAFNQAAFQTVLGWLDALPDESVRSHVELAVVKGLALFLLRSAEEARPYVEAAERMLSPDTPVSTKGQYLYQKALLALCDDQLDVSIEYAKSALVQLGDGQPLIYNFTMNLLGEIFDLKGDAESAAEFYQQAFNDSWQSGDRVGSLVLFTNLILTLNELGRRREAENLCSRLAESLNVQSTPSHSLLDSIYLSFGLLKYEANQLDIAREYVQRALNILSAVNFLQGISWGQYILAQIYLAEGKFDLLREISVEGQKLAAKMGMTQSRSAWFFALEAQVYLKEGNLPSALRLIEKMGLSHKDTINRWDENTYFTYVRILMAQERFAEAGTLLDTLEQSIRPTGRNRKIITVDILYSLLLDRQNRTSEAVSRIANAVKLAAPEGYSSAFIIEGQKVFPLLKKVLSTAPDFIGNLLLILQNPDGDNFQKPRGFESLTKRELEVLYLVSKGYSNREVASALFVSLGTVKKHLNNIFRKLDVKNRTQAINRGVELGLVR